MDDIEENNKRNEYGLSEDDMSDIVECFDVYSMTDLPPGTDRLDLPITTESLDVVLSEMGFLVTEAELMRMQEMLDPQSKGFILLMDFVEHGAGPLFRRTRLNEDNAESVFQIFDSDLDGMVRVSDIMDVLALFGEKLPESYVKDMLTEVDMDGDRAIGMEEFKYFVAGEMF